MIRTRRLLLRRWRRTDRAPFAAMNADPAVMEHFPGTLSRAASDAAADDIERHFAVHGWGLWAVEIPGDAPFIGDVGLWPATSTLGHEAVEVGWRLARPYWGRGYASEAARAALRFGFDDLGLEEIVSFTVPQNIRSIAVMERIGMVRDPADDFDHPRVEPATHPHLVRHVLYRLERSSWTRQRADEAPDGQRPDRPDTPPLPRPR